jgi:methionine synthase II (cobalamin-independent)
MGKDALAFNFCATGIGSVPSQDIEATCQEILEKLPLMPFWPQFVRRSYLEDMNVQFSEGLPLIDVNEEQKILSVSQNKDPEKELVDFYDHFLAQDIDNFSISKKYAPGLYGLLDALGNTSASTAPYIKGQTVGPVTFLTNITDLNGKSVIHNDQLREPMVNGLAIKALWQVKKLAQTGIRTVIFLDEPYLSGFGSAFSPIQRDEVIDMLKTVMDYLRHNSDTMIGIHCCGNTDWSMIINTEPDIISFDAFEYMDYFLLYSDELIRFLQKGGAIAWGIIPTSSMKGNEKLEDLSQKLDKGLRRIHEWGIAPRELAEKSIITPSCGMGTMTPELAKKGFDLLWQFSEMLLSH